MKYLLLIIFAVYSVAMLMIGTITTEDLYIGTVIMLAAEYIENAIERKEGK